LTCIDDGRGIDAESVRKAAVARGLIGPGEAAQLTREQVLRLVLRGGLTTATSVNEVSGRGVGLDVLRVTALRLRGKVAIESEPGHGTRLEVVVPLSLSATTVIVTDVGGSTVLIPLDAVDTMLRVSDKDITRSLGADAISYAGQAIPFVSVARALGRKGSRVNGPWSVAIVRCTAGTVAIAVDGLLGTANVVVRPLPELMDPMPWVTGVSLDAQGTPRLVIDPIALANSAGSEFGLVRRAARVNLPILVVDDSLTTRMLEQSILETAGYDVELATSAEEALVKAQNRRYLMFVVDVEMPGMNGFEFIQRTQSDPTLCEIPAVLVTSRNAPEDLERGRQVGAKGYIVKGEFDQGELLRTIARLTGTEAQE
jgi:two-component system chemotaxis sensor kinase CheA